MLELKNIVKSYKVADITQQVLKGIDLTLRDNEFVSILGPSGSGKTTLLNIIGGLDQYDSGDLLINGVSTKKYKDREWDTYRNHSVGFVFQSYNLIPHQNVLSNVELALTIGGISGAERVERAKRALIEVGLEDHIYKKPNQLSGGQMQRVAIARALVNDPEIILADEPTGALDTKTSIQIMDILKKVAKDRLVVMVTHNPELAESYSTRIVTLRDGEIGTDSDPVPIEDSKTVEPDKKQKKASMSFFTALKLSFNNLKTKKGRTFLTAFAGSIGIIGIATILALSTGVNGYISDLQESTMQSYPVTITSKTMDLTSMLEMRAERSEGKAPKNDKGYLYSSRVDMSDPSAATNVAENDLTNFKKYLDDKDSKINKYLGKNGIVYSYKVSFGAWSYNSDGKLISSDTDPSKTGSTTTAKSQLGTNSQMASMFTGTTPATENFSEMMVGQNGSAVSDVVKDNYKLVEGKWPTKYDEVVLVLDYTNMLSPRNLYQLGLISREKYDDLTSKEKKGKSEKIMSYKDVMNHEFYIVPNAEQYKLNSDGTYSSMAEDAIQTENMVKNGIPVKIAGIIQPKKDANNANISTCIAYTSKLTDYIIERTNNTDIVKKQEANPDINVLTGLKFEASNDDEKAEMAKSYIQAMGVTEKANFYRAILNSMATQTGQDMSNMQSLDENTLAGMLTQWLNSNPDKDTLIQVYNQYIGGSSYQDNMDAFGKVSYDAPESISIYTDSFEDKDSIADCIEDYNKSVSKDKKITYTDYVKLMTSSLTSIVNVISYVLIAFVAVSLLVSCIMIGIITHISVMERTKEIGILRALGASKRNVSQVFNAETIIIGFISGLLGILISWLLTFPINSVIEKAVGDGVNVHIPTDAAVFLVILSVIITVIGGLMPAKSAAKKDPVVALRTE